MVRGGIAKTRMFLLSSRREAKRVERHLSKPDRDGVVELDPTEQARISSEGRRDLTESSASYWTPHPRTGIYVPKGHEYVVDDVPKNAASFDQTYWLRNIDGVEKTDHNLPPDNDFGANNSSL